MSDSLLLKVTAQMVEIKLHLAYLKELYNSSETVLVPPDWRNCFSIAIEDSIKDNLEVILNTAANYLQNHNKIATKIVETKNAIFVKTENNNA